MKLKVFFITLLSCVMSGLVLMSLTNKKDSNWEYLLDKDLSQWDVYIGVPHYTVDIEGYEKGDGMNGTPLGLNNDPLHVYSTIEIEGETVLKVDGIIYGGISTKKVYENYHLSMKFKWGEKKYEPRLDQKRDSGILYHCQDPHGAFWNVWMQSQEMQVQEGDCGDYYTIAGTGMDIKTNKKVVPGKQYDIYTYNPQGKYKQFKTGEDGRCRKMIDAEKPLGEWNQLDLVCLEDKAYHIVNGTVVMVLENSVAYNEKGEATPLTKGKIQIQSEAAEVYYKDIKIKSVSKLPKAFAKQLK